MKPPTSCAFSEGPQTPRSPRVSIAPSETFSAILLLLGLAALFVAAATLLRDRKRRRIFSAALLGSALLQIVLGSLRVGPRARVHGPFVNADHFAGYLEIALAVAFGGLWAEILTSRDRVGEAKDKLERFEKRFPPLAVRVLIWGSIGAGIALTQSRGALLSAGVTTLALLATAGLQRRAGSPHAGGGGGRPRSALRHSVSRRGGGTAPILPLRRIGSPRPAVHAPPRALEGLDRCVARVSRSSGRGSAHFARRSAASSRGAWSA